METAKAVWKEICGSMELWWGNSGDRSAAVAGCKPFREDRQGREAVGKPCVRGSILTAKSFMMVMIKGELLWIRIRGKANKADTPRVSYRPPNQHEEAG